MGKITALQIEKWKHEGDVTALVYGIRELENKNKRLKKALGLAYKAYKDKCLGKTYTVKQIARIHRFCKQALKEREHKD